MYSFIGIFGIGNLILSIIGISLYFSKKRYVLMFLLILLFILSLYFGAVGFTSAAGFKSPMILIYFIAMLFTTVLSIYSFFTESS